MEIRCIIFDIDNTLYSYDDAHAVAFRRLQEFAQETLDMDPEVFRELHRQTNLTLKTRMGGVAATHNRLIRYQNMLEHVGKDVGFALEMNEIYWHALLDAACPLQGATETLEALHEQGVRVGIGTNMTARIQLMKLRRLGLLPYVDFLVSSEEAGVEKPDPMLFELCVEKSLVTPDKCMFVGDNLEKDVLGASACGLHGVWFNPRRMEPAVEVQQIQQLTDVLDMLDEPFPAVEEAGQGILEQ